MRKLEKAYSYGDKDNWQVDPELVKEIYKAQESEYQICEF